MKNWKKRESNLVRCSPSSPHFSLKKIITHSPKNWIPGKTQKNNRIFYQITSLFFPLIKNITRSPKNWIPGKPEKVKEYLTKSLTSFSNFSFGLIIGLISALIFFTRGQIDFDQIERSPWFHKELEFKCVETSSPQWYHIPYSWIPARMVYFDRWSTHLEWQ